MMLAYNFRPSRPKAANSQSRLTRSDSMFKVERGAVSPQKRDINQLNDSRSRSCLHRESNVFKTKTQRHDLTLGEQEIQHKSPQSQMATLSSIQTWPLDQQARHFAPKCLEYVQNYHHYKLDINKLRKGQNIPYLSSSQPTVQHTNNYSRYFAGLPKRTPKSALKSRQNPEGRKSIDMDIKTRKDKTLQDLILSEIKDELNQSVPQQQSYTDLRAPLVTPVDTPRSSLIHSAIPGFPHSSPRSSVTMEIHKPYLSAFTTRIPPLKSCSTDSLRRSPKPNDDHLPDYQRYRILCDAFRPCTPYRPKHRHPVPSQVLEYYTHTVNNP